MPSLEHHDSDLAPALLKRLLQEKGAPGVAALLMEHASPGERAEIIGMFAVQGFKLAASKEDRALIQKMIRDAGMEVAAPSNAEANIELSAEEFATFKQHAEAHPWKPHGGTPPSAHIQKEFAPWLGRGLRREHVARAQDTLAAAYAKEIERHPERRIPTLLERARNQPPGTPPPAPAKRWGTNRLASELSPEELEVRREKAKERMRRSRARAKREVGI